MYELNLLIKHQNLTSKVAISTHLLVTKLLKLFICFCSHLNLYKSDHRIASETQLPDNVAEKGDLNSVQSGCSCVGGGGAKGDMQQLFTAAEANSCAALPQLGTLVLIALFSGSLATGRQSTPCSTATSGQVSCLNNRKIAVMF